MRCLEDYARAYIQNTRAVFNYCYRQMRKYILNFAKPMGSRPSPKDIIRFLKKVKETSSGCWEWLGHKNKKEYGQFWWHGRAHWAHRWARQAFRGGFKPGLHGNHKCLNPSCVNPDHINGMTCARNTALGNKTRKRRNRGLPVKPNDDIPF